VQNGASLRRWLKPPGYRLKLIQMKRAYYSNNVAEFLDDDPDSILGQLVRESHFAVEQSQRDA